MRLFVRRPSPAMIVASLALLVAAAGTGYAAVALPANSVGTAQLRNNAITSAKVRNGSLVRADFKSGQLLRGPAGAQGPAGPQGAPGPAARWALVRPDGSVVGQSGGVTLTAKPGPGLYVLDFGSSVAGKLVLAASARAGDPEFRGTVSAAPCGGTPEGGACPIGNDTNHVQVVTNDAGEKTREDHAFYVAVVG
jgi:hypothetical protein